MAETISYLYCGFCDISGDPGDKHCMSCGGSLGEDDTQLDSNEALLALVTQIQAVVGAKTKGLLGANRELKMSIATGTLCTLWMFSCLIIVNMMSFGEAVFGSDSNVVMQTADAPEPLLLEPTLQAAREVE